MYFIILSFYLIFFGVHSLSHTQVILVANLMALLVHQFEEYILPGGAPIVINIGTFNEQNNYLRYLGNMQSSMVVNSLAHLFYAVAVFFSEQIWLGLGLMFFNFIQLPGHGHKMNKALNAWYNPGLLSVILLFLPIGFYYIYYVFDAISWQNLLGAVATLIALIIFTIILPVRIFRDENSPYQIPESQLAKFNAVMKVVKFRGKK